MLKSAERMSPTLFCMELCPEVHYLAEKLQGYGHHTKVIDGAAVKEYIKTILKCIGTCAALLFGHKLTELGLIYLDALICGHFEGNLCLLYTSRCV